LEVTWEEELIGWKYWSLTKPVQRITQTSLKFLLLQSTTCWCTNMPEARWARGAVFWADSEARVQIAPSGMMKTRNDGFVIFSLLFGVGVLRWRLSV
jgi:hypothetical protein